MASGNQLFTEDGILPGLGKKTQKAREEAFMKFLTNFERRRDSDATFFVKAKRGDYV